MGAATSINSTSIVQKSLNEILVKTVSQSETETNLDFHINVEETYGDVEISGNRIDQSVNTFSRLALQKIQNDNVMRQFKSEVEQNAKALIKGLNLGQISTSISALNSVIDDCIKIGSEGIAKCSTKINIEAGINVVKTHGNVKISDNNIIQLARSITECITKDSNNVVSDTKLASNIKQLASSTAEGLDLKWLALVVGVVVVAITIGGVHAASKFLGPALTLGGVALIYFAVNMEKKKTFNVVSDIVYIKDYLFNESNIQANISVQGKFPGKPQEEQYNNYKKGENYEDYGEADIYEVFTTKMFKYNCVSKECGSYDINRIVELINDLKLKIDDLEITHTGSTVKIQVKNSNKYKTTIKTVNTPNTIRKIEYLKTAEELNKFNKKSTLHGTGTVTIDLTNFEFSHFIKVHYEDTCIDDKVLFEPTILGHKEDVKGSKMTSLFKNIYFDLGLVCSVVGIIITSLSFKNDNRE